MARCTGTTRNGGQCAVVVNPPNEFCYLHDPAQVERRKRAASRGGRVKGNKELRGVKTQLQAIADGVLEDLDPRKAAVATQALSALLRAIEVGRRLEEQEEIIARLEALEAEAETAAR